ncbi:MAG TPA: OmpA family protein [Myxococcaceae bacterium]
MPKRFPLLRALALLVPALAGAQQDVTEAQSFPVERLRISTNRQGLIDVEEASVLPHLAWDVGLWLGYARDPLLVYRLADNARVGPLVENRLGSALLVSVGLFGWVEVGADLPLILFQGRPGDLPGGLDPGATLSPLSTTGAGDFRLLAKVQILRQGDYPVGLSLMPSLAFPSGGARAYFGDAGPVFSPEALLSWRRERLRAGLNLGAAFRGRSQLLNQIVESEITGHAGVGYRLQAEDGSGGPPLELEASLSGAISALRPLQSTNQDHLELRGMAAYDLNTSVQLFGGAGLGLVRGWGTPRFRFFAGARFGQWPPRPAPPPPPPPPPPRPVVVAVAEPPDRDHDGLPDARDACPDEPETKNGYQDDDGCPDEVPPPPPPPDPDRDGDGVPDRLDNCPDAKGPAENQGCEKKQLVQITRERLEIIENVYFKTNKDVIETRSFTVLENVVAVLKAHPEVKQVLVEGHTDSQGDPGYNLGLSDRRANAVVRFLVARGIEAERLKARGFGQTKPIADNGTREGREKNRRVVFTIQDGAGIENKDSGPNGETREETPTPKKGQQQ